MLRIGARLSPRSVATIWGRQFSAAVEADQLPKAADTAGRYAHALYNAARKTKSLDVVVSDVKDMQHMTKTSSALSEFLVNPSLPRQAKVEALSTILEKSGFSDTFSKFVLVMAENGRTGEASKAFLSFQDIMAALKGEVIVKVTTAVPLSEWELALLKKRIKLRFFAEKPDADLSVETSIDSELLGGLTVQVGDRFMDLSTRTELRKLQEVIMKSA